MLERGPARENLGVLEDGKMDMSQQCAFAIQKVSCTKSSMVSRAREGILPLSSF